MPVPLLLGAAAGGGAAGGAVGGGGALLSSVSKFAEKVNPVGIVYGAGQMVNSMVKKSQAKKLFPNSYDNQQLKLATELEQQMRRIDSGTAYNAQTQALNQQTATLSRGISNLTGGAGGAGIGSNLRLARQTAAGLSDLYAQGNQNRAFYQGQYGALIQDMANRRLSLDELRYSQKMAEAAQAQKEAKTALLGSVTNLYGSGGGSKKVSEPQMTPRSSSDSTVTPPLLGSGGASDGFKLDSTLPPGAPVTGSLLGDSMYPFSKVLRRNLSEKSQLRAIERGFQLNAGTPY